VVELEEIRARYPGVPVLPRRMEWEKRWFPSAQKRKWWGTHLAAATLIWNAQEEVALLRHRPELGWGDVWATPGGMAELNETPEETARREAREEVGIDIELTGLSKVFDLTITDGITILPHLLFFQFEGTAATEELRAGEEVIEACWLDALPQNMAFREDYVDVFERKIR